MKLIDLDREKPLNSVSMYLTSEEADWMRRELEQLLKDPEANEHFHVHSLDNAEREISCSIITEAKLSNLASYNRLERTILTEK